MSLCRLAKHTGQSLFEYWFEQYEGNNPKWEQKFRMPRVLILQLYDDLKHHLKRALRSNRMTTVDPGECILLGCLFMGNRTGSMDHLEELTGRGASTIRACALRFADAVVRKLKKKYVKLPDEEECAKIAAQSYKERYLPMGLGGIDGKHWAVNAGSKDNDGLKNYKGYRSVTLLG